MLNVPVNDAIVAVDMDYPNVGMGHGAMIVQQGYTTLPIPFRIISDTDVVLNAEEILDAAKAVFEAAGVKVKPVRVILG